MVPAASPVRLMGEPAPVAVTDEAPAVAVTVYGPTLVPLGVKLTLAELVVMAAKLGVPGAAQAAAGVLKVVVTAGVVPPPAHTACRLRL